MLRHPPSLTLFPYTTLFRSQCGRLLRVPQSAGRRRRDGDDRVEDELLRADRKSTRLNSSHQIISYAVFCLKKKRDQRAGMVCYRTAATRAPGQVEDIPKPKCANLRSGT